MLKIRMPGAKRTRGVPRRQIRVGTKTITVKAHRMSEDWVTGIWSGIIGTWMGILFSNTLMMLSGMILTLILCLWYFYSYRTWRRTVLQPAIERALRTPTRKPRTRKAQP
jgi:hypothetical protein